MAKFYTSLFLLVWGGLPLRAQQQSQTQIQVQGTITIKKEPTEVGLSSLIKDLHPASPATLARLSRSGILGPEKLQRLLPRTAEFQVADAIEFKLQNLLPTIVVVPARQQGRVLDFYAFYAFSDSGSESAFVIFLDEASRQRFLIRDQANNGMDITYNDNTISNVVPVQSQQPEPIWNCVAQSLKRRVDLQELAKFGIESAICAAVRLTCLDLAIEVGSLAIGAAGDCINLP
jgi:hypothetical protein